MTTLIANRPCEVDAEGFLQNPEQWSDEVAVAIDGRVYHHARYEKLHAASDVHLIPPVAGGAG